MRHRDMELSEPERGALAEAYVYEDDDAEEEERAGR